MAAESHSCMQKIRMRAKAGGGSRPRLPAKPAREHCDPQPTCESVQLYMVPSSADAGNRYFGASKSAVELLLAP